jgi:hypothetical protein
VLHTSLCPSSGYLTNLLLLEDETQSTSEIYLSECEDIFVKVEKWRSACKGDITDNDIRLHELEGSSRSGTGDMVLPGFVKEFNGELDRTPSLDPVRCFVDFPVSYLILMDQCRRTLQHIYYLRWWAVRETDTRSPWSVTHKPVTRHPRYVVLLHCHRLVKDTKTQLRANTKMRPPPPYFLIGDYEGVQSVHVLH